MLKELYCVSEAPLVVLNFELQFVRGDMYSMQTQGSESFLISTTDQNLH